MARRQQHALSGSRARPQTTLSAGDVWVVCPLDGDWRTIRPRHAAWSAAEAHRIQHVKGWRVDCTMPEPTPLDRARFELLRRGTR